MNIFIAGDSTAAIKQEDKRPESGWGEKLNLYLEDSVTIKNFAVNGRSTKSFINEGLLDKMVNDFNRNDYLIVQFGHNDGKVNDLTRYTNYDEYMKNLSTFVDKSISKGVTPIIFSSVSRRKFLDDNYTIDPNAVELYPLYAKEFAKTNNVLFVDMFKLSQELYTKLGFELSKKLFLQIEPNTHLNYLDGVIDNTHFNETGATIIASIVVSELLKLNVLSISDVNGNMLLSTQDIIKLVNK